jgi:hypothetical protein
LTLVVSIAAADEPAKPAKPIGTWKLSCDDGSWSIAVENSRLVFTGHGPGERVTTLSAPRYDVSEEGVLFGYFTEVVSTLGEKETRSKNLRPFAFRFKAKGDTLTVSDACVWGAGIARMSGDYKKEATEAASKPQSSVKR